MIRWLFVALAALPLIAASPVDFAQAELQRAMAERGVRLRIRTEIVDGLAESFRILPGQISGGDLRGLMYGILEAADQIRATGRLTAAKGQPAMPLRGIRKFLHNEDLEKSWYYSRDYWTHFFEMLARNRFNRFNLVFAHQTAYLAPPYPYWLSVPEFPEVKVPTLTRDQQSRNLQMLQFISQSAAEHGIDFTLGIWQHDVQPNQKPSVAGLTPDNIGPYSHAALKAVLAACPSIRSIQMRTNSESGIPRDRQVAFYRDFIYPAIREAGRLVTLDLRGWVMHPDMLSAATQGGVPLRLSTKYWAEDLGRPYQPAETFPGYSYFDFLRRPRQWSFYWELWGLGSHRLLLWGDPDYVRRAVSTFTLSDSIGFEIDPPLAQKGYGNRPGEWDVFTEAQKSRVFWKNDFERYWLFYLLWGRLSYDPKTPEKIWLAEAVRRFGSAARDVLGAYAAASRVLNEIVAAHLADPNMYIWPEVNPGGLIDVYREVLPSDQRYIAGPVEAVRNRVLGIASAKQTPRDMAALLSDIANSIDSLVARAGKTLDPNHVEWRGTEPDFRVLSALARFHAHKQLEAEALEMFYQTENETSLYAAQRESAECVRIWRDLASFTDGLYPSNMAFGPDDVGHWKDRLLYVEHDAAALDEQIHLWKQFGHLDYAFDFGGKVEVGDPSLWRRLPALSRSTVQPRFTPVNAGTQTESYGWAMPVERKEAPLPLTPYLEMRSAVANPQNLPSNVLFGDYISGQGDQTFRIAAKDGEYRVHLLKPDGTFETTALTATGGRLDVVLKGPDWKVSGLIAQRAVAPAPTASFKPQPAVARPTVVHTAPFAASANRSLTLSVRISPLNQIRAIRLHFRAVNQLAPFETIEAPPSRAAFTIPAKFVDGTHDLMYYFEIINTANGGWFYPDPLRQTPYFVIKVEP